MKNKKRSKVASLDANDYQQGLEYAYVALDMVATTLGKIPVINEDPVVQAQFQKVGEEMVALYQIIGQQDTKLFPTEGE